MSENTVNVKINDTVNVKQSRGAGTVLMIVCFGWLLVGFWWPLLLTLWIIWMIMAAIVSIFDHGFFARTWYYPWPAWMFGIR
jgi:hypothetical protein